MGYGKHLIEASHMMYSTACKSKVANIIFQNIKKIRLIECFQAAWDL